MRSTISLSWPLKKIGSWEGRNAVDGMVDWMTNVEGGSDAAKNLRAEFKILLTHTIYIDRPSLNLRTQD